MLLDHAKHAGHLAAAQVREQYIHQGDLAGNALEAALSLSAAVDVDAVLSPPSLYFYRAAGTNCSGLEGP